MVYRHFPHTFTKRVSFYNRQNFFVFGKEFKLILLIHIDHLFLENYYDFLPVSFGP